MNSLDKLRIGMQVFIGRPIGALQMLYSHRRTLNYLWWHDTKKHWRNFIFTTLFIRGEDCGKGILDPVWKLTGKAPYLWDIEVETTTRCYLSCIHCEHTYWKDKSYLNQDLHALQLYELLDAIPNLKWINLTGEGCSLLNNDFLEMLQFSRHHNLYIDFSHDFFRLSKEQARAIVALKVDRIFVSLDGATKEVYEKVRVGSNFEQVINNIKLLVAEKKRQCSPLPEICFRFAFFKDNMQDIVKYPDLIHSIADTRDLGDEPSLNIVGLLEFEETKGWVQEIGQDIVDLTNAKAKKYGFKVYWSHPTHLEKEKPPLDYCTFWSEPYIMIGGYVLPCCGVLMSNKRPFLEKNAFGNVNNYSLKEIWDSNRYRQFRKMVTNTKGQVPILCYGCRVFNTQDRADRYGVSKVV